jgi:hypothetical protein
VSLRRGPLVNTCGLPDCASPCHLPVVGAGPYCAPFRCYCGGCPGHVPVVRTTGPVVASATECDSCRQLVYQLSRLGLCEDCQALRLQELSEVPPLSPPDGARPMDRAQLDRIRQASSAASAHPAGS